MSIREDARKVGFAQYSGWDGEYHTSGYAGAFDAGFDSGYQAAMDVFKLAEHDRHAHDNDQEFE